MIWYNGTNGETRRVFTPKPGETVIIKTDKGECYIATVVPGGYSVPKTKATVFCDACRCGSVVAVTSLVQDISHFIKVDGAYRETPFDSIGRQPPN